MAPNDPREILHGLGSHDGPPKDPSEWTRTHTVVLVGGIAAAVAAPFVLPLLIWEVVKRT